MKYWLLLLFFLSSICIASGDFIFKYKLFNVIGNQNTVEYGLLINEQITEYVKFISDSKFSENHIESENYFITHAWPRLDLGIGPIYNKELEKDSIGIKIIGIINLW